MLAVRKYLLATFGKYKTQEIQEIQESMIGFQIDHPRCFVIKLYMDNYIIHVFKVGLKPCDPMTLQQVLLLKYALLQHSDDLRAGIKTNCFLAAFVFCKKN